MKHLIRNTKYNQCIGQLGWLQAGFEASLSSAGLFIDALPPFAAEQLQDGVTH